MRVGFGVWVLSSVSEIEGLIGYSLSVVVDKLIEIYVFEFGGFVAKLRCSRFSSELGFERSFDLVMFGVDDWMDERGTVLVD